MKRLVLMGASLLGSSGCWVTNDEIAGKLGLGDDTGDTAIIGDPIQVASVSPSFGSTAGGTQVQIIVDGLGGAGATVSFAGVDANVVAVTDNEITAITPASSPGFADIAVVSGSRRDTLSNGFRYYPDQAGQTGVLGVMEWIDRPAAGVDDGQLWLAITQPTPVDYRFYAFGTSTLDTCVLNTGQGSVSRIDPGVATANLSGPADLSLTWNASQTRYELPITVDDFVSGATFDLEPFASGDLEGIGFPGLLDVPFPITVSEPVLDGTQVVPRDVTFEWNDDDAGDWVGMQLQRYRTDIFGNTGLADVVTCVVEDDGLFTVPETAWSGWSPFDQITVFVGRAEQSDELAPHDNSRSQVIGLWWTAGAVFQEFDF